MVCSPRPAFAGPATLPTPCWVYELSSLQVTTFVRGSLGQCAMPAAAAFGSGGRQVRKAAGAASITHCPLPSPACCVVAPLGAPGSMPAPEQRGGRANRRWRCRRRSGAGSRCPAAGTPADQAAHPVLPQSVDTHPSRFEQHPGRAGTASEGPSELPPRSHTRNQLPAWKRVRAGRRRRLRLAKRFGGVLAKQVRGKAPARPRRGATPRVRRVFREAIQPKSWLRGSKGQIHGPPPPHRHFDVPLPLPPPSAPS